MKFSIRTDWFDIDDEVMESIKNKELLAKEHDHLNKLIQQMDTDIAKFLQWLMGAIVLALGAIFSTIYGFSIKLIEKGDIFQSSVKSLIEFMLQVGFFLGIIFLTFFLVFVFGNIFNRRNIVLRKEKILKQLND